MTTTTVPPAGKSVPRVKPTKPSPRKAGAKTFMKQDAVPSTSDHAASQRSYWNKEEVAKLTQMVQEGKYTFPQIAKALNRSVPAVTHKIQKMKLRRNLGGGKRRGRPVTSARQKRSAAVPLSAATTEFNWRLPTPEQILEQTVSIRMRNLGASRFVALSEERKQAERELAEEFVSQAIASGFHPKK